MTLIQKIIGNFRRKENLYYVNDEDKNMPSFYLPYMATIQAVKLQKPLTDFEINDYLDYITSNYFMPAHHSEEIDNFAYEWAFHTFDIKDYIIRKEKAIKNIKNALKKGVKISYVDALWVSDTIYVDDHILDCKRIVTKEFINGKPILNVKTTMDDRSIELQVDNLRTRLIELSFSKDVAINK